MNIKIMTIEQEINILLEEAQANLTLYIKGQDDYALQRYYQYMDRVQQLREKIEKL